MKKKWLVALTTSICALLMALTFFLYIQVKSIVQPVIAITSFEECKDAGFPIMETYPEQCRTPEGDLFVQIIEDPIPEPVATSTSPAFEIVETLHINDTTIFPDGLSITLKEINDSRCKPEVQCLWAGELAPLLLVTGGEYKTIVKDVRLGTTNNRIATIREYSFILERATETEIDLVVKKSIEAHTPEVGYISGKVTLGPICPVEQAGVPCVIPAETYTSRKVIVFATDQQTVVKTTALDAGGWYKLTLDPGTYWLQVEPAGIGPGEMKKVTVTQLQTSVIDFDIDTGIR